MLQQIIVVISFCLYIIIVILGLRKSNTAASEKGPVEKWAIINREFVEFTPEEIEWRSRNV